MRCTGCRLCLQLAEEVAERRVPVVAEHDKIREEYDKLICVLAEAKGDAEKQLKDIDSTFFDTRRSPSPVRKPFVRPPHSNLLIFGFSH